MKAKKPAPKTDRMKIRELKKELNRYIGFYEEQIEETNKWRTKYYETQEGINEELRGEIDGLKQDVEYLTIECREWEQELDELKRQGN